MNKEGLTSRIAEILKNNDVKKSVSISSHQFFIMDEEGNQYKTKGWLGETTKATLYWANGFENSNVWQLPADVTLYLIMRKCTFKGSIEVESVDQATYDAYTIDWGTENPGGEEQHQAIDQVEGQKQVRKMIIDGQLRIVRGEKVFDATGRQL